MLGMESPAIVSPFARELHDAHLARQARYRAAAHALPRGEAAPVLSPLIADRLREEAERTDREARQRARARAYERARQAWFAFARGVAEAMGPPISPAEREALVQAAIRREISIADIIAAVAGKYEVTAHDILASRRSAKIVRPRQIAMALAKLLTLKSLLEIGRRFGPRDHTTVLWAVRKIDGLMESSPALRAEVDALAEEIAQAAAERAALGFGPGARHVAAWLAKRA